ncbi:MAG TPA: phospholipase D-like domain-containing protein [Candidatus Saccharimonadales bacterium]|nr:phospholipase D-like domain-containing protein [Candidatus Saccharimonadales bacterium]
MKLKPITILNGYEYFAEITEKIAATKAGDRVGLMSMAFDPTEKRTAPMFHELLKAAKRGVQVQFNIDAYSFMVDDAKTLPTGPIFKYKNISSSRRADYKAKYEFLTKLEASGGKYCIMNMPKRRIVNPYAGRSHIKICLINDEYYIGGSNLSKSWQMDLTARVADNKSADIVFDFLLRVSRAKSVRRALSDKDKSIKIDDTTTLIIDSGVKNQSMIFTQALAFIDNAKKRILLTCQFFPASSTAQHLTQALHRKVDVKVYYGPSSINLNFAVGIKHYSVELGSKLKYPKDLFKHPMPTDKPKLHAKLIATEQGIMIGSHNYATQGVSFGTAESSLLIRRPAIEKEALDKLESTLKNAELEDGDPNY